MSERGVTSGATGSADTRQQPDLPAQGPPGDFPFPRTPPTAPDLVPTALLHPPVADTPTAPRVAADRVARKLTELAAGALPAFEVTTPGGPHAVALAAHCPDLFLISTQADRRTELAADLAARAVAGSQRVLVLTAGPEEVLTALADKCPAVGRAVAPGEDVTGRACVAFTAQARALVHRDRLRATLAARSVDLQTRVTTEERREKLRAAADAVTADLDRAGELAAAAVEQSDALKALTEARDAGVAAVAAHAARRTEVEQELSSLRQSAGQPVGFFKKLFGGAGKPEPGKVETTEAILRELDAAAPADPHAAFAAARERLVADRTASLRTELEARRTALQTELATLPPAEPLDELGQAFADVTADLTRLETAPPALPAALVDAIRVVVGLPAAVGHDPFLSDTHPEVEPRFDRVIWADAEDVTDNTFADAARLGASWVLIGTPDPMHPPGYRNGRPRAAFFSAWWERLHSAAWTHEGGRPLARLLAADRGGLHCEPLHDRQDVEVRWVDRDGTPALAEVLFPAGMPLAEAKRFLACEADEARVGGYGPCEWDVAGDVIRCRWPAVDAASGTREAVDLGSGVTERTTAGLTAELAFCAKTWTRDSAARWVSERTLPPMRTATV